MIDIEVGQELKRAELHKQYRGSPQGGICPAPEAEAIFLFTDPKRGKKHGYPDSWGTDGRYHYCAQGLTGDQEMTKNNLAVLNHVKNNRRLYLFATTKRTFIRYIGEFIVDPSGSHYLGDGLDENNEKRQVIMFRLLPQGEFVKPSPSEKLGIDFIPASEPSCEYVQLEAHGVTSYEVSAPKVRPKAQRRESDLVHSYRLHLEDQGHTVTRHKIIPSGEREPLFTDLYDHTSNTLIEAKGHVSRESVRMAVGQLIDYRRHISGNPRLAALFPVQPRSDLRDLCTSINIATIWRQNGKFEQETPAGWNETSAPEES